ncbi:MAG: PEF-CTERM sorting domain-containing protein, partial [Methanosarcinales archaeon]|nr:PEF-CTERM sorting domain-containing protein [Methanosarcinales archaeon]
TPTDTQPGPTEIPEFPTLLLPITAILGLMFWFARKT